MKKTILSGVLLLACYFSFGQDGNIKGKFSFAAGPALSLPVGDLKYEYKYGAGIEVAGIYGLGKSVQGFVQTGLHIFKTTGFYSYREKDFHFPVLLGARYISNGIFAGVGVGYARWYGDFENGTGIAFNPQAGYAFNKLQITAHYTGVVVSGGVLGYAGIKVMRVF